VGHRQLKYEPHQLECQSPQHQGPRNVWTTYYPRKGERFYCDDCRAAYRKQRAEAQEEIVSQDQPETEDDGPFPNAEESLAGEVVKLIEDRGFGFLRTDDGREFFFHLADLMPGVNFEEIEVDERFTFQVKKDPSENKAGAAQSVTRLVES